MHGRRSGNTLAKPVAPFSYRPPASHCRKVQSILSGFPMNLFQFLFYFLLSFIPAVPLFVCLWFFIFRAQQLKISFAVACSLAVYHVASMVICVVVFTLALACLRTYDLWDELSLIAQANVAVVAAAIIASWLLMTQGLVIMFGLPR